MNITSAKMEFTDDSGEIPVKGTIEVGPLGTEVQMEFAKDTLKEFFISLVEWFQEMNGVNYVEQHVISPTHGQFTILVQKYGGETPSEQNMRLRDSNAALLAALKEAKTSLIRAEHLLDATRRFIKADPLAAEGSIFYDETDCDVGVLGEDCDVAAENCRDTIAAIAAAERGV